MVACSMEELTVLMEPLEIGLAKFWVFNLSEGCNMMRTSPGLHAPLLAACENLNVWANARSNYRMRLPSWQVTEEHTVRCTFRLLFFLSTSPYAVREENISSPLFERAGNVSQKLADG